MMGTIAITIICVLAYLGVSLLCPTGTASKPRSREAHTPRHAPDQTLEQAWTEYFMEAWMKNQERWIRYAWVETWPETVSW